MSFTKGGDKRKGKKLEKRKGERYRETKKGSLQEGR